MDNEYYGVATTPTSDFLAHYGVKGMKWGVRKALARGNDRALSRQYAKAQKKLAKLEKRAANGKKYAKRAAALGAGAAAAGGLAAAGTKGVSAAMRGAGHLISKASNVGGVKSGLGGTKVHQTMLRGANAVDKWGASNSLGVAASKYGAKAYNAVGGKSGTATRKAIGNLSNYSNNTLARIGAGAVGAGLAAGAGYNAYRAATTKRAAKKAAQFRSEMNRAFAGTKYANGGSATASRSKKRKRK